MNDNKGYLEISVVMPCLNEAEGISSCINKAKAAIQANNLSAEIIVVDNGSTDNSVEIARKSGVRVIIENKKGYGRAYQLGIEQARGKYIIIGDSDDTYDFSEIMKFILPLRQGWEFVNGNRLKGRIHSQAMPHLHRYFGNPLLSFILNLFFKSGFSDAYCGMKAFTRNAYDKIRPICPGMEFALELIINVSRLNLRRLEVPIELYPRKGKSKLRTFRDGWRSLRFMLLYCPNYLFLFPGTFIFIFSFIFMSVLLLSRQVVVFGHLFGLDAMIFSGMFTLLGFQLINLGVFAKSYSLAEGYENKNSFLSKFYNIFNLEKGILVGFVFLISGVIIGIFILRSWIMGERLMRERQLLFALTLFILGIQIIFSSFLISLVGMKRNITIENY
jgi:glycosyltransferase involved in cell wall biosynthesis